LGIIYIEWRRRGFTIVAACAAFSNIGGADLCRSYRAAASSEVD
jgi:hypothetical protein